MSTVNIGDSYMADKKERNQANIYKIMWGICRQMEILQSTDRYDVDALLYSLSYQMKQLNYFYKDLIDKQGSNDANKTYYNLRPAPSEHQLIYVSLCRGFPKELYDGHWCYLLKNCGTKFLVIPVTSIKETSSTENQSYYYDIVEEDDSIARLRFDEMRTVDKMRVITKDKSYRNVKTERAIIENKLMNYLNLSIFSIDSKDE